MEPDLLRELTELLKRWHELSHHARVRAEAQPNSTYDGYMLALEIAADDLTRVMGKTMKRQKIQETDN